MLFRSLDGGRRAVAKIVGRNPDVLDEAGIARAAIESLAENFSDGVVAPILWIVAGGFVGVALYKAINTADSMIGHRDERHRAFGWASARDAARAIWRDAARHRSPNAGWPEAAMAGALGLKLAGPRVYGEERVDDAFMGDGRYLASAADIRAGLRLYRLACVLQAVAIGALALIARA